MFAKYQVANGYYKLFLTEICEDYIQRNIKY